MTRFDRLVMTSCVLVFALVSTIHAQENGSFRLDPKTGKIVLAKPDYSHKASSKILHLVLVDWMTNPKVREDAFGYLIDPDKPFEPVDPDDPFSPDKNRPKLKRLLIDRRFVPKGFVPKIPKITVELFDRSKQEMTKGEMCIRIDRFEPKKDETVEVEFLHAGYGIIGGAWVTYKATKNKGTWSVKYIKSFDP